MQNNIFKITTKNQWRSLSGFIFMLILWIGTMIYFSYTVDPYFWLITFWFSLIFFMWWGLPALIFHIDYYRRNKGKEYEILKDKFIVRGNGSETTYMKSDIADIYVYGTPNYLAGGWIYVTSDEGYNFARIDMKNGESIYLTSLLYPKGMEDVIKEHFAGIPYYTIKRLFCTTRYKSRHEKSEEDEKDYYGLFKDEKK